jgi:hypothetical protein
MVSRIRLQFGRWKLCDKMEWLGGVESAGLLILILFMIPFPRLDILLAPAGYIYLCSLSIAFIAAFLEQTPSEMSGR